MAAGKWKIYDLAKKALADGTFDLDGSTFKVTLHSSASNANTLSTALAFSNITNELSTANGYTAGGVAVTPTWTNSAGTETYDTTDATWTASGGSITARFAVLRGVGTLNGTIDPILAVCLLDVAPADVTATTGNPFTIQMNVSGLFTLSGATTD
jgi:hypothetical protein